MTDPLPPQNIEAEEAVLGCILIDSDAIYRAKYILSPGDFYRKTNGWVYEAALALHENREPIDLLTLSDRLENKGHLKPIGGMAFLTKLIGVTPSSLHLETYAGIITNCANNRRILETAGKIAVLAYKNEDSKQVYSDAATLLRDINLSGKLVEAEGGDKLANEMLSDLAQMEVEKERREAEGYEASWPWPQMRAMARWRIGQPAVIIAEGGAGKTAFCMAVGAHNAINGGCIFYVATEDKPQILRMRQMSSMSGVPFRQIESATYETEGTMSSLSMYGRDIKVPMKLLSSIRTIDSWRGSIHFLPATGRTVPEIIYDLSRLEMSVGHPDAVIMDWFLDHKQRPSDNTVIGLMADILDLKNYGAEHDTRLLIATQTGKSGAGKSRLTSYDAYYTSAFAHYGKLVMSLKRERELVNGEPIGQFKPEIEVFISKANLDITGSFKLAMKGETLSIFEPETMNLGYAYDD